VGIAGSAASWPGPARGALALWGAFVLIAGIAGRVKAVSVSEGAFVVRRALLPERTAAYGEIRAVLPPRWPLGAWRIERGRGSVTLMPSDLRGAEATLAGAILQAGLDFRRGAWRRPG
jgi:hypothetical protein